jgi:hypothetical protein
MSLRLSCTCHKDLLHVYIKVLFAKVFKPKLAFSDLAKRHFLTPAFVREQEFTYQGAIRPFMQYVYM